MKSLAQNRRTGSFGEVAILTQKILSLPVGGQGADPLKKTLKKKPG